MTEAIEFEKFKMKWKIHREYRLSKDAFEYTIFIEHLHGYKKQRFDWELSDETVPDAKHGEISELEIDIIVQGVLEDLIDYSLLCAHLDEAGPWWDFEPVIPAGKAKEYFKTQTEAHN